MSRNPEQEGKSRSQAKREYRELKSLGIQLAGLTQGQLAALPMSEKTCDALLAAQSLTRSALQRQYRYISSLLAKEDVPALREAYTDLSRPHAREVASMHETEQWRDRLLSEDRCPPDGFFDRYPECDLTHLRNLVKNAKKESERGKPPKSARQLFRYLRELSQEQG